MQLAPTQLCADSCGKAAAPQAEQLGSKVATPWTEREAVEGCTTGTQKWIRKSHVDRSRGPVHGSPGAPAPHCLWSETCLNPAVTPGSGF